MAFKKKLILIGVVPALLLGVAVPLIIGFVVQPPPGAALATADIQSAKAFELRFTADGQDLRVWLDMACDSCSFPVTGEIKVIVEDRVVESLEISAGDSRDRAWGGTSRKLEQHLLIDTDAQPAGKEVVLRGKLVIGPARGNFSTAPVKGAPPPRVKTLRLTVAP